MTRALRKMTTPRMAPKRLLLLALASLLLLPAGAPAAESVPASLVIAPGRSEVRFFLQAPKHGVEGRSRSITGSVQVRGWSLSTAREGWARVDAASLDAGNPLINRNMRGALATDRHPEIVFEAAAFEPGGEVKGDGSSWRGVVSGDLTLRGVTRRVDLDVRAAREGEALRAAGSTVFKLTDFGIDPPRFLGFLRLKDRVRVEFDVVVVPEAATAPGLEIAGEPEAP